MIKSDTLPNPPRETPPNGTPGPAGRAVPDTTRAVGNTAQSSGGGDGTTQSSDWLAEARVGGGTPAADEPKGPPMRSGTGGADREGHTEESHRGQY